MAEVQNRANEQFFSINSFLNKTGEEGNIQIIRFLIENNEFAIDIMDVKEIKEMDRIRRLPNSKKYVAGLLNLRGEIIPVVDLKKRLEIENITLEELTSISDEKVNLVDIDNEEDVSSDNNKNLNNENNKENLQTDEVKSEDNNKEKTEEDKEKVSEERDQKENLNEENKEKDIFDSNLIFQEMTEEDESRNIIICNIENIIFGIIVDKITQVQYLVGDQFEPTPKLISSVSEHYISGFAKVENKIIPILNLRHLVIE